MRVRKDDRREGGRGTKGISRRVCEECDRLAMQHYFKGCQRLPEKV